MVLFTHDSRLADAIFSDSSLIAVLSRLGVHLGVGDATIAEVCSSRGIDPDFFVAIVNTFLNNDYFPKAANNWNVLLLTHYLETASKSYTHSYLPNIERHLNSLIRCSGKDNNLEELHRFFLDVKKSINTVAENEISLCNGHIYAMSLKEVCEQWQTAEDLVSDLASFFVIHLRGEYDTNLCVAVVNAIFMLQKDLRQNNRLRRRLLLPLSD